MKQISGTIPVLRRLIVSLCAAAGGSGLIGVASAQEGQTTSLIDLSIEQLMELPVDTVYTASRYEQKVTRAPASVSIVSADEIRRFGYRSLAEVLNGAVGLHATYDRNYTYLGFRGFSRPGDFNTRILLLVDGHRVNDALYGLMYVGNEAVLDVDMIERVEIIRGPASSVYGNSAIFGVINVITRRGKQIDGMEADGEIGNLDTYKARLTFGKQLAEDLELTLSGSHYDSGGNSRLYYPEFDNSEDNHGVAVDRDGERVSRLFGSVTWRDFTLSAAFSDRQKQVPTAPYGTVFNSDLMHTVDKRGYVDLAFAHEFTGDLQLLARASYDWYPYDAVFPYAGSGAPANPIINVDSSKGRWARGELQLTKRFLDRHTLIVGAEYQDNRRLHQANYDVEPYESFLNAAYESSNSGLYAQGELMLSKELLLNAGVRYDHFDSIGGTVNPRLGLIYNPWRGSTFKLLYGQAFRAPSNYEVGYQSINQITNHELGPETIHTYELVYEQYLAGNLRLSASGYQYCIEDLISLTEDPVSGLKVFRNVDSVRSRGLELQLERRYAGGLLARGGYSWQRSEEAITGLELSNSPRHLASAGLSVPLRGEKLLGSIELQYSGKAITVGRQIADDHVLVNLTLFGREVLRNTDLSFTAHNLLDESYRTPSASTGLQDVIAQDGRSLRMKVVYHFRAR